ncbi:MAG: nuclear transport factor 2 family protein [Steroidobacteraceae bacterium]
MTTIQDLCCGTGMACADVPARHGSPTPAPDQAALLESPDPRLAANKRLVFDMWRAIIQGGHTELARQYFTADYIQHNPNVASGRDALVAYMKATRPVRPIEPHITFPVVAMVAERDLVTVATVNYLPHPQAPERKYTVMHFDMFRIEDGRIAEHWDNVMQDPAAFSFDPNVRSKP